MSKKSLKCYLTSYADQYLWVVFVTIKDNNTDVLPGSNCYQAGTQIVLEPALYIFMVWLDGPFGSFLNKMFPFFLT